MKNLFIFPVTFLAALSANALPLPVEVFQFSKPTALYQSADSQSDEYEIPSDREVVIVGENAEGFLEAAVLSSDRSQVEIAGYIQKVRGCNGREVGFPSTYYFRDCPTVLHFGNTPTNRYKKSKNQWPDCTVEQLNLMKRGQKFRCAYPMWFVIDSFLKGMNRD